MLALENAEEVLQILDRYTKQKSKDIPPELDEYLNYVAKTGDTVYRWPTVQYLFREKLIHVIKEFHDTTASIEDLPQCPNVDQFNYESMKSTLLERLELFHAAPFTIQRLCELLTDPKKHYSRLDKFMRALEKNILVVSTIEPGLKPADAEENGDESINGDVLGDINIDMEVNKDLLKIDESAHVEIDVVATKEPVVDSVAGSSTVAIAIEIHSNGNGNGLSHVQPEVGVEAEEHIDIEMSKGEVIAAVAKVEIEKKVDVVKEAQTADAVVLKSAKEDIVMAEKDEKAEDKVEESLPKTETPVVEVVAVTVIAPEETPIVAAAAEIKTDTESVAKEISKGSDITVDEPIVVKTDEIIATKTEKSDKDENVLVKVDAAEKAVPELAVADEKIQVDAVVPDRPVTPKEKHPRDETEDDDDDCGSSAKKIRLGDSEGEQKEVEPKPGTVEAEPLAKTETETVSKEVEAPVPQPETPSPVKKDVVEPAEETAIPPKEVPAVVAEKEPVITPETIPATIPEVPPVVVPAAEPLPATTIPEEQSKSNGDENITEAPVKPVAEVVAPTEEPTTKISASSASEKPSDDSAAVVVVAAVVAPPPVAIAELDNVAAATPAAPLAESMTVEDAEAPVVSSVASDAETAMEAAPIKPDDDEKMEVDDSNSVDPMDL